MLLFALVANAQVARWGLKPTYDKITINNVGMFVVEKDGKKGLYDQNWQEIVPVEYDVIRPFSDGYATLFKDGYFMGVVNEKGKINNLFDLGFDVPSGAEDIVSGSLLVYIRRNGMNFYRYIDAEGKTTSGPYAMAYPYSEGYAVVRRFTNERDLTQSAYDIIDVNGASISLGEERMSNVTFASSFTNGKAILIIKNKFYTITTEDTTPQLMYVDNVVSRKNLISLYDNWFEVEERADGTYVVPARNAWFRFDQNMKLIEYQMGTGEPVSLVEETNVLEGEASPRFKPYKQEGGDAYGFSYKERSLLPPQFDDVVYVDDRFSIVRVGKYYGVLTLEEHAEFSFVLNSQSDIGFLHRDRDVTLTAYLPTFVDALTTKIESHSPMCTLIPNSREAISNVEGNFITYKKCRLHIPEDLSDKVQAYHYKFSVHYDDLKSEVYDVVANEWYQPYYNVTLSNKVFQLSSPDDAITIDFEVTQTKAERHDEQIHHKIVEVYEKMNDGTEKQIDCTQHSETHYSFQMSKIESDNAVFFIRVHETDCPIIEFPVTMHFDIPEPVVDEEGDVEPQNTTVTIEAAHQRVRPKPVFNANKGDEAPKISVNQGNR